MSIHLILKYFNINIAENSEYIVNYSSNIFILLLVLLFSFLNVIAYFVSIILVNRYESFIVTKYPSLIKIINFYVKTSIFFVFIEILICLIIIIFLLYISYLNFTKFIV